MPFRPPPGHADPDPDATHIPSVPACSRIWRAVRRSQLVLDACRWQLGGHLWWRRSSEPHEQVTGYLALHYGGFDDFVGLYNERCNS
jgi:hypothetical protein